MCLEIVSKDLLVTDMKETGLNRYVLDISVDYFSIDVGAIHNIYKYL